MTDWVEQIELQLRTVPALIMVTVLRVTGSVPREPGARMLVSENRQSGTIGGGNLEFQAIQLARSQLTEGLAAPRVEEVALGPGLGQCCGGRVALLYETITAANAPHLVCRSNGADDGVLQRAITGADRTTFEFVPAQTHPGFTGRCRYFELVLGDKQQVLCESSVPYRPQVWVFGAGHVGAALVAQLSLLPCDIVWFDERDDYLVADAPAANVVTAPGTVKKVVTDDMVGEVCSAPADACFIIMTHSHAIDYELCREILSGSYSFVGLIGSETKRRTFEHRLKRRGFSDAIIDSLVCPVGLTDIQSDQPCAIALGVATQLLRHWESKNIFE